MKATGYNSGRPFILDVVEVDGVMMSTEMQPKWVAMRDAAKADGVDLVASRAFATMHQQKAIYQERQDPKVRALKGGAARPGFSRHQSGKAVDIRTGLTVKRFASGERTAVYLWLEANASRFGFKRTVTSEPWHWEID